MRLNVSWDYHKYADAIEGFEDFGDITRYSTICTDFYGERFI